MSHNSSSVVVVVTVALLCSATVALAEGDNAPAAHVCQHAEVVQETAGQRQYHRQNRHRNYRTSKRRSGLSLEDTEPIRVHIVDDLLQNGADEGGTCFSLSDTYIDPYDSSITRACTPELLLTTAKLDTIQTIMDATVDWMESTFRVQPLDPGVSVRVPVQCSFVRIDAGDNDGADLVLHVAARPTKNGTLAFASGCVSDSATRRPVVGFINFGPAALDSGDANKLAKTAFHETTHVLGVSFATTIEQGRLKPVNPIFYDPVNDEVYEYEIPTEQKGTVDPYPVYKISTPKVVQRARAHFGCSTIDGVFLEDVTIAGTGIVHWEKRIFFNEYMTGTVDSINDAIVSPITLAYLEDTGWYKVDYTNAELLFFGRNQGCAFYEDSCDTWDDSSYFCTSASQPVCSFDHVHRSFCPLATYTDLDDNFEYFEDPSLGGSQILADYCPIASGFSNGDCTNAAFADEVAVDSWGENYCTNCRCAVTSLAYSGDDELLSTSSVEPTDTRTGCFEMRCASPSRLKIRPGLGQRIWYDCPSGTTITMVGYVGGLVCPDNNNMCFGEAVDESWPVITGIAPTSFGDAGGDMITVTGKSFGTDPSLVIGGKTAEVLSVTTIDDQEMIVAITPEIPSNSNENFFAPLVVFKQDSVGRTGQVFGVYEVAVSRLGLDLASDAVSDFSSFLAEYYLPVGTGSIVGIGAVVGVIYYSRRKTKTKPNVVVVNRRPAGSFPTIRDSPKW